MVSCREFVDLFLDGWLAGELPPRIGNGCQRHLERCAACRSYVASFEAAVDLVRTVAREDDAERLPEPLVSEILARL